ncbi:phage tail spike protein [Clostridium perfringens]|uniref:phage tail spike protein n=1 Tax=Clostridium perfringens TaxID=1502 RepID=UPI0024BD25AD|nr:phage tail spike protein [Clostridium perfringens]
MNKIEFYKPGNINYSADGNVNLTATKALFKIQLNGICEIEIEQPYDPEGRWKLIDAGGVIKAPTPYSDGQLFGIYSIKKNMRKTGLVIKARHIIFDLYYSTTEDIRAVNCTCKKALEILLKGTSFTGESNIVDLNTCYFVKMNRIEAINGNKDNTILKRWGGEIFPDNFTIYVNKRIGNDYGVEVTYGKNMLDLGLLEDRQNIVTRIKPVAFNGRRLPELFVDSPLINKYRILYEKYIEFENLKLRADLENDVEDDDTSIIFDTEEELYAAMREECKKLFENGIDKPTLTGSVKVAPIENSDKYKGFKNIVNIGLGDTIRAYHSELGIDIKSRCIGYTWNILTRKYEEINIGDEVKNFFQNTTDTSNIISKGTTPNGEFKSEYITGIIDALKCQFRAQRDVAQTQPIRAMIFEDKIKGSATYGAMCLGTMGFQIASRRTPDDKEWEWETFGTGQGFFADWLVGKLRTVLITNMDNSFEMDLNKPGGMIFRNNGLKSMLIENNALKMFNWKIDGQYIGGLTSLIAGDNKDKPSVGLTNSPKAAINLGYEKKEDTQVVPSYMQFDKYNVLKDEDGKAIRIWEDIDAKGRNIYNIYLKSKDDKSWITVKDGELSLKYKEQFIMITDNGINIKGDLILDGVIKNTSGNLVLDPNAPQGGGVDGSDSLRNSVVNSARKLIGKPYVWGGNYPPLGSDVGTDCSGLMQWSYHDNGITLSRTTYTQINEGFEVKENELKPGDLIFMHFTAPNTPQHVFMYSGEKDGQHMCVEAPRTGLNIRERAFTWGSDYRARRIIKDTPGGNVNGNAGTKASKNIIYYVKGIEGYAPYHYYDSVGVKTLGYGMTGSELSGVSVPLSETSATHYLVNNFNRLYYVPVLNILKAKGVTNMLQREVDAFASFAYNCGVDGFKSSQLLAKYVAGERGEGIHNEFKKWVHGGGQVLPGLVRRREEEWKIFSGSSSPVGGYNTTPSISYIGTNGLPTGRVVTENGGYGASPY